jgi:hypothetical protein
MLLNQRDAFVIYPKSCPEDAFMAGSPPDRKRHPGSYEDEPGACRCRKIRQAIW